MKITRLYRWQNGRQTSTCPRPGPAAGKGGAKENYDKADAALEREYAGAGSHLHPLREATGETWDEINISTEHAWGAIGSCFPKPARYGPTFLGANG